MISYLTGKIKDINEKSLTILTDSGVGYKVYSNLNTLLSKNEGENIEMLIHTVVKDDAIDLYGFEDKNEIEIFEKLITVSGVGPRSALSILSASSVASLALAIENNDLSSLPTVSGVGKKSLEKIVLELKGKLSKFIDKNSKEKNSEENDARLALSSIGYNDKDINLALSEIKKNILEFEKLNVNEIIKEALKYLK